MAEYQLALKEVCRIWVHVDVHRSQTLLFNLFHFCFFSAIKAPHY